MDGHFVPNLSMGPVVVKALRKVTHLPLEVHLMVEEPDKFVNSFLREGADTLIVHQEVLADPRPLLRDIRQRGKKIGLAVNPETPISVLEPYLTEIDLALCMTVHPGYSGQKFVPESPARIRQLRNLINRINPSCELEVDGGINLDTIPAAVRAGANVLVAASAIFDAPEGPAAAVHALRACAEQKIAAKERMKDEG